MNDKHEVISAFLDDEAFQPDALAAALSEPEGRQLLIDLIALRHLAQTERHGASAAIDRKPTRAAWRALAAAAALFVALAGGYMAGQRRGDAATSTPPPATRVVQAPAAWQDVPVGRMQ